MKAGRKRRQGVKRYENGAIVNADRGEKPEQIMATGKWQRISKLGANVENFRDHRWGSPLGRMRVAAINAADDCEGLSDRQYQALVRYIAVRHRYRVLSGFKAEAPKAIVYERSAPGYDDDSHDEEACVKAERAYNGARRALLEYGLDGVEWVRLVERLAVDDDSMTLDYLGPVRCAANVLARYFEK